MHTISKTAVLIEFLGTDTSNSKVRLIWCWSLLIAGPLMAAASMTLLPEPSTLAFYQIASPLTGFCGSVLWLAGLALDALGYGELTMAFDPQRPGRGKA